MKAVVIGPFITPMEADPAKMIVRPSPNPDDPMIVEIPASTFERQRLLGNVTSAEAFAVRREGAKAIERKRAELEREAAELEELAMMDVETRALIEDFESLDGMSKNALVEVALRRKLHGVNTRRGEDAIRKDVRAALEPLVAKTKGSASPS